MDNWRNRRKSMICSSCMFFVAKTIESKKGLLEDSKVGRCRRHCPVVQEGYPVVFDNDFCGDFKLDESKV